MSYFGPQGYRGSPWTRRTPPREVFDQTEKLARRRQWLRFDYDAEFDLDDEIEAICSPLAAAMAELPHPLVVRDEVEALAAAVHDVCSLVVSMVVERGGLGSELRSAVRVFAAMERGQVSDGAITSGSWVDDLTGMVTPFSTGLAVLLGRGAGRDGRGETLSDRLVAALRPLDAAARDLAVRIPKVAERQALGTLAEHQARCAVARQADRTAARLAKLGMTP